MKIILAILLSLAAVTFPIYFIVFIFKSLLLGIMAALVTFIWILGQVIMKLNIFGKRERTNTSKLIGR